MVFDGMAAPVVVVRASDLVDFLMALLLLALSIFCSRCFSHC